MNHDLTTRELIELSLLDAMGLLEEDERDSFDRAFATTSAEVQAHIRREQTRLSQIDFLLPNVEPAADLRSAVLEAVRRAMNETADRETAQKQPAGALAAFMPALIPSRRVSPLWRAGAVGFATAAVVFGVNFVKLTDQFDKLKVQFGNNEFTDATMSSLRGAFPDMLFNPNTQHVAFTPNTSGVQGQAVLLMDPESQTAFLICRGLPSSDEGRNYKLVVINDDGQVGEKIADFTSNSGLMGQRVTVKIGANQRLAIVPPTDSGSPEAAAILTTSRIGS